MLLSTDTIGTPLNQWPIIHQLVDRAVHGREPDWSDASWRRPPTAPTPPDQTGESGSAASANG